MSAYNGDPSMHEGCVRLATTDCASGGNEAQRYRACQNVSGEGKQSYSDCVKTTGLTAEERARGGCPYPPPVDTPRGPACAYPQRMQQTHRERRLALGLSQYKLATIAGCSKSTVKQIELGRGASYGMLVLVELALLTLEECERTLDRTYRNEQLSSPS